MNDAAVKQALLLAPYQSWGSGQRVTDNATPTQKPWGKRKPKNNFWKKAQAAHQQGKNAWKGQGKGQGKGKKGAKGGPKPNKPAKGNKRKGE